MTTTAKGSTVHLNVRDVVELQAERGYPLVSIYVPLSAADSRQGPIRVKNLIREAELRLSQEFAATETKAMVSRLNSEVTALDFTRGGGAVALFASAHGVRGLQLPYAVDDEVVIDDTFATRNLIHAIQRMPRYLVAVVAPPVVRLFEATDERLDEVAVEIDAAAAQATETSWSTAFARAVDEVLDVRLGSEPQPLLLLAPDAIIAGFTRKSSARHFLTGSVAGDFSRSSPDRIQSVVMPHITRQRVDADRRVFERLIAARGAARLASGVNEVWDVVRQARVTLLAVEENYRYPAIVRADGQLAAETDPSGPGVLDDAVDEMIEITLRHDGEVRFVADKHLAEWDRIAAVTRW